MHLQDIDHTSSPDGAPTFRASIILYISSVVFYLFQSQALDLIWTWVWRGLSLVSLILIIYINWNKAIEIFRSKKKHKKK